jgi:flavin reductase
MTVLTHTTNQLKSLLEKITPSHRSTHLQVDQQAFRQGMSNLGAAVNVITTDGVAGKSGFTACRVQCYR